MVWITCAYDLYEGRMEGQTYYVGLVLSLMHSRFCSFVSWDSKVSANYRALSEPLCPQTIMDVKETLGNKQLVWLTKELVVRGLTCHAKHRSTFCLPMKANLERNFRENPIRQTEG